MKYSMLANQYKVSKVGIGGHYRKMEEGSFEKSYANVDSEEIKSRTAMIERAYDSGINYFDTTWRNEVDMLAKSIEPLNIRDNIFINGMVLGAFSGSTAFNMDVCDYVDQWLDERLKNFPQNRFDSFMINAIEEKYDEGKCEKLIRHLEKRKQNGDFKVIGFSCHNHVLARKIADTFPEFELIMTAYNYKNRAFEENFDTYKGNASFVAMKPLIWYEYGVPFCHINNLANAKEVLGIVPVKEIATSAIKWNNKNRLVTTTVCAVNSEDELTQLIAAVENDLSIEEESALSRYRFAIENDRLSFHISSIMGQENNSRSLSFALNNLARALDLSRPHIPLNTPDTESQLKQFKEKLFNELRIRGYGEYIK